MRPIKFRAWDREEHKMFEVMEMKWYARQFQVLGCNLMQYTDLKDKNGKEIYEGDICKNGDWEKDAHAYNERIEEVKWDEDNAMWIGWNPNEDGMMCEVIGNIYENPELLKEEVAKADGVKSLSV